MPEDVEFRSDSLEAELFRILAARNAELEAAQRQLLAYRLAATVQHSFVAELQQSTAAALSRAERAEHEARMARLAHSGAAAVSAQRGEDVERRIHARVFSLLIPVINALRR